MRCAPAPGRRWSAPFKPSLALLALLVLAAPLRAADDAVEVTGLRNPVDKSYRRMVAGMDLFEARRAQAPAATLRFRLLPRHRDTNMADIQLEIVGDSFATPLDVAPDNTFALPRDAAALKEKASVRPNRKAKTMTWRAEVRSPGVPAGERRLGDLRLECAVGMEAGLVSNFRAGLFGWVQELLADGPAYCDQMEPRYLFFADRPVFSVTLVDGARREAVRSERLWAGATREPDWREKLPWCDCEVLVDRAYFLPLGDASWPDDTRVLLEPMEDR